MVLTAGVNNTRITLGVFEENELLGSFSLASDRERTGEEYTLSIAGLLSLWNLPTGGMEGAILSSVVPSLTPVLTRALGHFSKTPPLVVGPGLKTGFPIRIDNPAQLGSDMVANVAGAVGRFSYPLVVVEMGTAITMTALDATGAVIGVAIAPGLSLSLRALRAGTAQLAEVSLEETGPYIGRNTADSLRSGVVLGAAAMVDGMLDGFARELGETPTVVLTGADGHYILERCRHPLQYEEHLLLTGLYRLYRRNPR